MLDAIAAADPRQDLVFLRLAVGWERGARERNG
jgi:hypothetical protein